MVWNNFAYAGVTPLRGVSRQLRRRVRQDAGAAGADLSGTVHGAAGVARAARAPPPARGGVSPGSRCWLAASLPAIAAGGFFRQHYFVLALPPMALLAGIGLDAVGRLAFGTRDARARRSRRLAALALLGVGVADELVVLRAGSRRGASCTALRLESVSRSAGARRLARRATRGRERPRLRLRLRARAALLRRSREREPLHVRVSAHDAAAGRGGAAATRRSPSSTRRRRASWSASSCAPRCSSSPARRRR